MRVLVICEMLGHRSYEYYIDTPSIIELELLENSDGNEELIFAWFWGGDMVCLDRAIEEKYSDLLGKYSSNEITCYPHKQTYDRIYKVSVV
jgi:hypothetical protein